MIETNEHMVIPLLSLLLDKQLKSGREKEIMLESLPYPVVSTPTVSFLSYALIGSLYK